MPSKWHRRFTSQRTQQRKMHKRRPSSMYAASLVSVNNNKTPSMGLFDEFGQVIGMLVDCYLDIQVVGLRSRVSQRILFRNKSGLNVRNSIFRARTAVGAVVTSAECYIDVDKDSSGSLEYKDIVEFCHQGTTFECDIGSIKADKDLVVFLRYEYDLTVENEAAVLRFPLPGRRGERLIARQKSQPALWNASQMFSFIALDVRISDFPAKITNVSSSHSVYASISEESNATIDIDDYMFQGQDEVILRILSEPLKNKLAPTINAQPFHAITSNSAVRLSSIPVIVVDETSKILTEDDNFLAAEGLVAEIEKKLDTGLNIRCSSPSNIEAERLYSEIWEVSPLRMSYCSSSGESTVSFRSEKSRRRKTTVHRKPSSEASSTPTSLTEMSWLDDPSDDEVNDEAEKIFEEYSTLPSRTPPRAIVRDSFASVAEFGIEECKSIRIVRPHRAQLITIESPTIPPMSLDNITPPSSPIRSSEEYQDKNSNELLRELDALFNSLNMLMVESPTVFFSLNESFASALGLDLFTLQTHRGAQSYNLSDTPSWIREGVWANAIALQFLRCVMDSPFYKTLSEEVRSQFRLLYSLIDLPFSSHIQHLSPAACINRYSEEELLDLASELIQEQLIDGEADDFSSCGTSTTSEKVKKAQEQFVARPISPPKTPDEEERRKAEYEVFVNTFQF
ncbi:hypothetical protein H072_9606 [Dactylellina haptotyla CBS 200.50]|uniref:EF-hand domain-containing protein n=1 Tax=Dactylellina haptotyla (strain CBS 200.50) TaxID=1284197 RepID=S8A2D5_DACHA|nr:hypothetical protein H072_9606 [Dactylellina haptotyla CBS 200.50]